MSAASANTASIRELDVEDTGLGHQAMHALRTAYEDKEKFVDHVDDVLRPGGYRVVAAFVRDREQAAAVAGFHVSDSLAWGHYLYVDDLSTVPDARRCGHGRALLDWLAEEARELGCAQLHLDSGVGLDRADAHRFYLNAGLVIASHHFARYIPRHE